MKRITYKWTEEKNVELYLEPELSWFFKQELMKLKGVVSVEDFSQVRQESMLMIFVSPRAEKCDIGEINRFLEGHAREG